MQTKPLMIRLMCLLLCLICALPALAEEAASRLVTLSGDPAETFTAETNCYAKGDRVLVYFQKGVTVPGDTVAIVQNVMAELEALTGLSFDNRWNVDHTNNYHLIFEEEVFDNLNPDGATVEVIIANLGTTSPYATENTGVIDVVDLEGPDRLALYHELAHVLYLRNAVDLGLCLDEGLATWTLDKLYRQKAIPCWNTDFYLNGPDFDEALITGGEAGFSICFEKSDDNYLYGFRFVTFLCETYGEDVILRLIKAATEDGFDSSFQEDAALENKADTEHMKRLLKSVTGEDVFQRFAAWHESEMPRVRQEYQDYIMPLIQE